MAQKSQDDLDAHFQEQMQFLYASAKVYDEGLQIEAVRLATIFRTLLHDGPASSKSLLAQMGVKQQLRYANTGMTIPDNGDFVGTVLAPIRVGGSSSQPYVALLHDAEVQGRQSFGGWWNAVVIQAHQIRFTRKDVVLTLANKEGGSHVDPKREARYDFLRRLGVGWEVRNASGDVVDPGNPALPTMRQMTFELEVTVSENERLSWLLAG